MKMKTLMASVAGGLLMAGCSTVSISEKGSLKGVDVKGADGRADRTLCVSNEGGWLLNTIPLCAASMDWNERKNGLDGLDVSFFRDETSLPRLMDAFYRYAERENCDVVDIVVDNRTTYPVGEILTMREIMVTGVLKERK